MRNIYRLLVGKPEDATSKTYAQMVRIILKWTLKK
jgi:hypothetical protein